MSKITGLLDESPFPCEFKKGDKVKYTNEAGVIFEMIIVGFNNRKNDDGTDWPEDYLRGGFIHAAQTETGEGSAWWFPHRADCFEKI